MDVHVGSMESQLEAAWQLRDNNPQDARAQALNLLAEAHTQGKTADEARALIILSYLDFREQNYELAFTEALQALDLVEYPGNHPWMPRLYNVLAILYGEVGELTLEREYLQRQIDLSKAWGDLEWEATGYHDLAIALMTRDLPGATTLLERALVMFESINLIDGIVYAVTNLADCYRRAELWEEAYTYNLQGLQLAREIKLRPMQVLAAGNQAQVCAYLQRHDEAERYLTEAIEASNEAPSEWQYKVWEMIGNYAMMIEDHQRARDALLAALHLCEERGVLPGVYRCHEQLSRCYEALGDYQQALKHYRLFFTIKEKVLNKENELKLRAIEVIHQTQAAQREAEFERKRNSELQRYIRELEHLQEQLREQSLRDVLTNLHNRRSLMMQGEQQMQIALRYESPLSVALFDVDHFKQINDNFSHAIGDQVLQQLALIVRQTMRNIDIVARYGGEEFVIVLPETRLEQAIVACERLRLAIANHPWHTLYQGLHVTVSIGIAELSDDTRLEHLLNRADTKLYEAKRLGRNRVRG
jgi:diguanylate cyclase (GGDEF)-like protein